MNGNNILLDTNAIIALLDGHPIVQDLLEGKNFFVSIITEIEIQSYQILTTSELSVIKELLAASTIIELNQSIKSSTIEIRKKYRMKIPDAIIAATALHLDIPILSADKGLSKVTALNLIQFIP